MSRTSESALRGRAAIVTGAGRGIGKEHALRLARAGAFVVVNDIDAANARSVVAEIVAAGAKAMDAAVAIRDRKTAVDLVDDVIAQFGRIDILINNAGVWRPDLIFDALESEMEAMLHVHLFGTINMTCAVAPHFRQQRSGVVINTGSDSGLGHYGGSIYAAAKEGIAGFTRSIARDFGPHGVRANMIRPVAITAGAMQEKGLVLLAQAEEQHGFPSLGDQWVTRTNMDQFSGADAVIEQLPEKVADFTAWLCSDEAAHINGRDFRVAGDLINLVDPPKPGAAIHNDGDWRFAGLNAPDAAGNMLALRNEFATPGRST